MRKLMGSIAALAAVPALATPPLLSLQDHRRVLIVAAPAPGSADLVAQDRLLVANPEGLAEREVTVVHVVGATVTVVADQAAMLRRRLGIAPGVFAVRLIGKDGHVALREARPVTTDRLFATIDAMPMRREEVARARR